jgi:glutamate--cysteine ligase
VLERQVLIDYLANGERPPSGWSVGTEYEKFAVDPSGAALPYHAPAGQPSISAILEHLAAQRGWSPVHEGENIVALLKDGGSITLEPGGQVELSGAPMATLAAMTDELDRHLEDLAALEETLGVRWLWAGAHPTAELDAIPWMPKARYKIMRSYLPTRGALAHSMMKGTATVQANLDFQDEDDMGAKLRAGMGLSALVAALFANSPMGAPGVAAHPAPAPMRSWRWHVWTDTDPDRCGLLQWVFASETPTYEQWVDYALDVPMFLLEKSGQVIDMAGQSFRAYAAAGHGGHQPTLDDWGLHLSTLFPDVRLKTYLEMRSADCVPPRLIPALPALWKGLLYDAAALAAAWDLVKSWTFDERAAHREDVCRHALAARVPGKTYTSQALAVELVAIARQGLPKDEAHLLEPLEAIAASGRTLADDTAAWLEAGPRSAPEITAYYADL